MHLLFFIVVLVLLVFGPQWWARYTFRRYAGPLPRIPGTGGELARHLLDRFGLPDVPVEKTGEGGDHYDPEHRVVRLGPDNYDRIQGWRIYEVTCDDPGLSKPAFLSSKNAEYPMQSEVEALDYYIENFVWGGLQKTTDETFSYGIYGIPDWKTNRESEDPGRNGRQHIWRIYDYSHITLMYLSMYRVAKNFPHIRTSLTAREYLGRAYGTALGMFTIPWEVERWSAYHTGLYNELVIPHVVVALEAEGMQDRAERLRPHWERKVRTFVNDRPDLFRSEYAFDSTGFEEEDIDDVCLVLTEVVNNSMEHASARPHEVEVDLEIDDEKLLLRVRDEGDGKITQKDFEHSAAGPPDHLEDRGRGLFLIASFSDDVKVREIPGGGTEVEVIKYRKGKA